MFGLYKKKRLLFYKYLISYLIIFLIPYMTISIVFYQMSVNSLREEIIQSNIEKLEQVKNVTDTRMGELKNIATRISLDYRLTPYMLSQPYYSKQAIRELNTYKVNSSFIDGLYLYYHGKDQIYSPKGTSNLNTFVNSVYQYIGMDKAKFSKDMEAVSKPTVLSIDLENNKNLVSYLYPIPPNNSTSYGTVMFFVKEKAFTKLIKNALGDFKGNIYIYNKENDLLAANSNGGSLQPEIVENFASEKSGVVNEQINNENYSLVTVRSKVNNWTFVTAMPTAQFYSRMSTLKTSILAILSIIAAIGIGTTIFMSFKQYKPIRSLTQFVKTKQNIVSSENTTQDELASIRETIELIYEDSEQLQNRMKVQQPFVRDQFLLKLLKGNANTQTGIESFLKDLQLSFYGEHFFVVVVSFKGEKFEQESILNREVVLNLLTEVSLIKAVGYGVELIHDNAIVLIVSLEDDSGSIRTNRYDFVKELTHRLDGYCKTMPTIGVGETYEGLDRINRSFIEANAAIEYALLNNHGTSIYFEDIITNRIETFWYPAENQVKFLQSLKQGDKVVAKEALEDIVNSLKERDISIHLLRCMCFDIINIVLKNISDLGLIHRLDHVQDLVEFQSLEDLRKKVNELIISICEEVEKRKESHNNSLRDTILEYVQEQYKSHDLSLEGTAEVFQLSASYLSRFMKEQTGTTFTQFVWGLRNQEFKRQLMETTYPIKDIVIDIGYVDVANFTRKFKKEEGLTPGQFRKHYTYGEERGSNVL